MRDGRSAGQLFSRNEKHLNDTKFNGRGEPLANGKQESAGFPAADESLYRSLVERIPGIFYIAEFGAAAPWHFVSPQIENYLGLTPEEWLADSGNWLKHIHPDDRELVLAEEQRIVETGTAFFAEYRMVSREGRVFWFRDESLIHRAEDSRPPVLYGILYDITAQKEAENEVRESEERLRLALEAANLGMWLWSPETDAILWDERECALYGVKPNQAPATSAKFIEFVHAEDREWVRQAVREGLRTGNTYGVEYRVLWPDGTEHWLASAGRALRDATGKARIVRGISYDITNRRGLEEQLRRVQKMEAVGQLAGGIAHDFNNLLTIIHGHVELLSQRLPLGSAEARDVSAIKLAADRAAAITGQLLAFGRKQVLQPRALDLRGSGHAVAPPGWGDHRAATRACARTDVGARGRKPNRAGGAEPGRQRARRHAGRRQSDAQRGPLQCGCEGDAAAARHAARKLRANYRAGHRRGHECGNTGTHLRTVLHDKSAG
jgi:PAS domain S-box-containing protein